METRVTDVDGAAVRTRVAGAGPPLVLVPGLGGSWRWWRPVVPALAEAHEVHLLDLPRFRGGFGPAAAAAWVGRWLDAAALDRPDLVGHSLGGLVAAELAALRPTRLRRLVLAAPAGIPTGARLAGEAVSLVWALRTLRPRFLPVLGADCARWGPNSLLRGLAYLVGADVRTDLGRVEAPTLLVWGERDGIVPVRLAAAWRDALADVRLELLRGAAHVPMVEAPSVFAAAVLRFLEEPGDEPGDLRGGGEVDGVGAGDDGEAAAR